MPTAIFGAQWKYNENTDCVNCPAPSEESAVRAQADNYVDLAQVVFWYLDFEFVSDFEFSISDLTEGLSP